MRPAARRRPFTAPLAIALVALAVCGLPARPDAGASPAPDAAPPQAPALPPAPPAPPSRTAAASTATAAEAPAPIAPLPLSPDAVLPRPATEVAAPAAPEADPFGTPGLMREEAARRGAPQFTPDARGDLLPRLTLRGYIEIAGKEPVALLEVEGAGVHMVRAGDTLTLRLGGRTPTLRISRIDNVSVLVQLGSLGQTIVVR